MSFNCCDQFSFLEVHKKELQPNHKKKKKELQPKQEEEEEEK